MLALTIIELTRFNLHHVLYFNYGKSENSSFINQLLSVILFSFLCFCKYNEVEATPTTRVAYDD